MARHTLDELETILLNLLHQLENLDLEAIDWENIQRLMEHWDEIIDLLNRLDTFPWEQLPTLPPPTVNQYTMIRHTRVLKASLEEGGRFEASSLLRGLVVLCIDEEPQSLYYCTGVKWLRVSAGNRLTGSYGYITDEIPLGYTRGDLVEIPVSKIEALSGVRDDIGLGMQITDAYHGVGVFVMIRRVEVYPELEEDMAVIATWIGEADGTNLYTNNEGDPGGFAGAEDMGSSSEVEYDYDQIARQMAATALDSVNHHLEDFDNPHHVTAAQIGLGSVDNIADADKPVSTAQQAAIQLAIDTIRQYIDTTIQLISDVSDETAEAIFDHISNTSNPHGVTLAQIGLEEGTADTLATLDAFQSRSVGFATAAQGTLAENAATQEQLNAKLSLSGGTMSGDINMGAKNIENTDGLYARTIHNPGGDITAFNFTAFGSDGILVGERLNMQGKPVTDLPAPVASADAATKGYVDGKIGVITVTKAVPQTPSPTAGIRKFNHYIWTPNATNTDGTFTVVQDDSTTMLPNEAFGLAIYATATGVTLQISMKFIDGAWYCVGVNGFIYRYNGSNTSIPYNIRMRQDSNAYITNLWLVFYANMPTAYPVLSIGENSTLTLPNDSVNNVQFTILRSVQP